MEVRKNTGEITMDSTTTTDNAEFWLPTDFLTDDDFLVGVDHRSVKEPKNFDLFSGGFDRFGALDSPVSSSETDKDHDNDEHELLAELTRQLARSALHETRHNAKPAPAPSEKPWAFSTSPQSTLTGFGPWSNRSGFSSNGSPSQVPSPPVTPPGAKNDAAWELLYEAAGQVARLKMNAMAAQLSQNHHPQQNRGFFRNSSLSAKSTHINSFYDFATTNQHQQQLKRQGREECYCQQHHDHHQTRACGGGGGALGLPPSAWPPLRGVRQTHQPHQHQHQHQHHHNHNHTHTHRQQTGGSAMRAAFLGGPGSGPGAVPPGKRQSTGTGVFLPRRIGTQPEPRKMPSGFSTVLLPARVVQALNLDLEEINNGVNHNFQSRFGSGFVTDHDVLIARRNALLNQQRRSIKAEGAAATMVGGHDIRLPSDWTY